MYAACKKYLTDNNILFKRDVRINKNTADQLIFDFIIPGAVILLPGKGLHKKIGNITEKMLKIIPADYVIYVYFSQTPMECVLEELEHDRILVIDNFDKIKSETTEFFVLDSNFFLSLGSKLNIEHDDLLKKYSDTTFLMVQDQHNFLEVMMDEEEFGRMKQFHIKIKEIEKTDFILGRTDFNMIDLTLPRYRRFKGIDIMFYYFNMDWITYSVSSSYPKKHIDGITKVCQTCNFISFPKFIKNDKCIGCNAK